MRTGKRYRNRCFLALLLVIVFLLGACAKKEVTTPATLEPLNQIDLLLTNADKSKASEDIAAEKLDLIQALDIALENNLPEKRELIEIELSDNSRRQGDSGRRTENYDIAEQSYEDAINYDHHNPWPYVGLIIIGEETGDRETAVDYAETLDELELTREATSLFPLAPRTADEYKNYAVTFNNNGTAIAQTAKTTDDIHDAIALFKVSLAISETLDVAGIESTPTTTAVTNLVSVGNNLIVLNTREGDFDAAKDAADDTLEVIEDHKDIVPNIIISDALANTAIVYAILRQYDTAIEHARASLTYNPDSAVASNIVGASLAALGGEENIIDARAYIETALKLDPGNEVYQDNLDVIQDAISTGNYQGVEPNLGISKIVMAKCEFPEDIALRFLDSVSVMPNCDAYIFGPVKPGTLIREDAAGNMDAVELQVPESPGTYYVFVVEDMPGFKFGHPIRYAWMESGTGDYQVIDASWWPIILEPETPFTPFEVVCSIEIKGITFYGGKGSGSYAEPKDISKKGTLKIDIPEPKKEGCENRKFALVIDCGSGQFDGCILGIPYTFADNMADDADDIAKWLKGEGFSVVRISQYWGNNLPAIKVSGNTDLEKKRSLRVGLGKVFEAYAEKLKCCDNFFLYLHGHADNDSFCLYDPSGTGLAVYISYSRLYGWLNKFPECVKFTIFIDACYSGTAIDDLKKLRDNHSKVVIVTSTDEDGEAPGGQPGHGDSATENFNEGDDEDYDEDGKKGDITDRFREMKDHGKKYKPQLDSDPRHGNNCVLD